MLYVWCIVGYARWVHYLIASINSFIAPHDFEINRHSVFCCSINKNIERPGFYTKGRSLVKSNLICPSDKLNWQPGCPVLTINIQSNAVITRSNIVRYYINNYRNWSRISVRCLIHKRLGALWGVFCEYLWENWPRYNGTALYKEIFVSAKEMALRTTCQKT